MITHDRWQRIKEIFHSAQDRTPAELLDFLDEACGDDHSLREEVEALLTADAGNEDFLTAPAYEFAAGMLASEASEFSAGQKVGRYTILCSLGSGGMGQIYLARDTVLGRKIALKLISPEFATDPRRVQRFEQEARAASALNHPNVCVIYEIGITDDGRHFIAMEYIQGVTLRDQLARGKFKPAEALQISVQVGAALASAHAAGIVHRDIKPENIMLRPDGYVKVVDFGLAKLTEILPEQQSSDNTSTRVLTEPRTLMGTFKYMSPEQLREAKIDERTDIWSLGVVLYEMLTGFTPFEAQSSNETVALILGSQPAELHLPAELTSHFQEVVRKTLEKDRNARYQTVTKLVLDLNLLQRELDRSADDVLAIPGMQTPLVSYRKAEHGSTMLTRLRSQAMSTADFLFTGIKTHKAAALFAGATGVLGFLFLLPSLAGLVNRIFNPSVTREQAASLIPATGMKRITSEGTSVCSAISFDGQFVAHAEEQNGKQRLVVTSTITSGALVAVAPADVQYLGISFSRDNHYLYFTRRENHGDGILYRVALPGSAPVKIKEGVDSPISFSPQGDRFAFVRLDEATSEYLLMVANVDGTNEQTIASRRDGDTLSIYGVDWSPDGGMVVCGAGNWTRGFHMKLIGFDLRDGQERAIGDQSWFSILQVAWQPDMKGLVISARERETAPHRLWRIGFPEGTAQKLTTDLAEYRGVSLAGDKIVTVRTEWSWRIWVSALDALEKATAITSGVGLSYGLIWTSKGKIVFSSMAQDRLNLSRIDPDGANLAQLTVDAGDNYTPAACPDGRIVFSSNRNGPFNIWRMNPEDGSDLKQLTFGDGNFYPACSPDNQWVAYDNQVKMKLSVFKVALAGGAPIRLVERYRMPAFSPDNQYLACRYDLESGSRDIAIFSSQGGRSLQHFAVPIQEWQRVQWLANSRALTYIKTEDGYSNIWSYDLNTGTSKQLTSFNSEQIYAYAWSPDYKQLACQRGIRISNVTMIGDERQVGD